MAWLHKMRRKNKSTNKTETYYAIKWRTPDGKTRTQGIGFCGAEEARRALKVKEGHLASGVEEAPRTTCEPSSVEAAGTTPTLERWLNDVYLPAVERDKAAKTYECECTSAKALVALIGHLTLDQINYAVVDVYHTERKKAGRRSRTIILELRMLKRALKHAVDCEVVAAIPRLPSIKDKDRKPHRFLTDEQAVALLDALRPYDRQPREVSRGKPPINRDWLSYLAVLMALNLGMRRGEIFSRRWRDVQWQQGPCGLVMVADQDLASFKVKKNRPRVVPLTPEVRAVLARAWIEVGRPADGWIFPSPTNAEQPRKNFTTALRRACRTAGIDYIHPHGLRHTWASRLAIKNVDRKTLMQVGGWVDGRMLDEVYAHVTESHVAEVMARVGIASKNETLGGTLHDLATGRTTEPCVLETGA